MFFAYSPDNSEGTVHQLQLFDGILTQITEQATTLRLQGSGGNNRFSSRGSDSGNGLTQRALHCRIIYPTSQHIAFFLEPVQISFHLCDTAGYLFGTTAEVHPAEFIQLRLQMVYFTLPVAQLFLQGVEQRFLLGQALF